MRKILLAAAAGVLGTAAFTATPAAAQVSFGIHFGDPYYDYDRYGYDRYGYGRYGYDRHRYDRYGYGYGRHRNREYRQELRECRRELRHADSRREYRRELRECRRELARASRGYRDYDPRWGHRNWRDRYWDGYRWRYRY